MTLGTELRLLVEDLCPRSPREEFLAQRVQWIRELCSDPELLETLDKIERFLEEPARGCWAECREELKGYLGSYDARTWVSYVR